MPDITFPANGNNARGYLARPNARRAPGVVVLHEWWGLDDHIRSVCDRLADAGFFALAPDLYRSEPTTEPDEARQRMLALSIDHAETDIRAAAEYLLALDGVDGDHVGAIGYSLGGGLALWAAATTPLIDATVSYYRVMPHGKPDFARINGAVLGHFGTADQFIPISDAKALEAELRDAGVDTTFIYYEGARHAFFNDTNRLGSYEPHAAVISWVRTVKFLSDHLTT
jgi:carboxymethylenebutenolidase